MRVRPAAMRIFTAKIKVLSICIYIYIHMGMGQD